MFEVIPPENLLRGPFLVTYAGLLCHEYGPDEGPESQAERLDRAITLYQEALTLLSDDQPNAMEVRRLLGGALLARFTRGWGPGAFGLRPDTAR